METIQTQFSRYLGKKIWNKNTSSEVLLTGIKTNTLLFINGQPYEQEANVNDFQIIVKSAQEAEENKLDESLAVIVKTKKVAVCAIEKEPAEFLKEVKEILYKIFNTSELEINQNNKKRTRENVLFRQIVMATYCLVYEYKRQGVTVTSSGKLFDKDHSTVIYAIRTINNLLDTDKHFREEFSEVWDLCKRVNPKSRLHI